LIVWCGSSVDQILTLGTKYVESVARVIDTSRTKAASGAGIEGEGGEGGGGGGSPAGVIGGSAGGDLRDARIGKVA